MVLLWRVRRIGDMPGSLRFPSMTFLQGALGSMLLHICPQLARGKLIQGRIHVLVQ
jgi:hypothetical protein